MHKNVRGFFYFALSLSNLKKKIPVIKFCHTMLDFGGQFTNPKFKVLLSEALGKERLQTLAAQN